MTHDCRWLKLYYAAPGYEDVHVTSGRDSHVSRQGPDVEAGLASYLRLRGLAAEQGDFGSAIGALGR